MMMGLWILRLWEQLSFTKSERWRNLPCGSGFSR
ncbi:class I SAM-dependent methyltransferase, partial [Pseudomonas sp. S36]|nr:class I SAM-dependent methyltransferase [Pseudomonas sp. S36]